MKFLALLISGFMMFPAAYAGGGGGGKKKNKQSDNGRDDYHKYEREDVTRLRDIYEFTMPEISQETEVPQNTFESETVQSVAPFFMEGNRAYLDQDMRLEQYRLHHIEIIGKKQDVPGWRIQVFTGSVRANAFRVKNNLMSLYPDMASYMDYDLPNYKVRLGDFLNKEEADLFCKQVREEYFPGAFLVQETIPLPKFKPLEENPEPLNEFPERN